MENDQLTEQAAEVCANCGNPAVLKEFPTKLCGECREKFIRFPVPKWLWAFAGGLGIILLFSLFSLPKNISTGIALERGKKAEKEHRFVTAQLEFEKVVAKEPSYIEAQGHLMKAAFYNLDFVTFGKALQSVEKKNIEDKDLFSELDALATKSLDYFPGDSLQQLIVRYDSLKTIVPENVLLTYIGSHANDLNAKMMYANTLFDKKNYQACDSIGHKILEIDTGFIPCLRILTASEREAGNQEESLKYCDRLISINQEYSFAFATKARTFLKLKKDKEALKLALQACELDKKDGYATATLALAYHFNNDAAKRDEIINNSKKDSLAASYMEFTLDVISKKEKFRD